MATYKTKDGVDRVLPGIGRTVDGKITTDIEIQNPMFELVDDVPTGTATPPTPNVSPAVAQPTTQAPPQTQTPNPGVN